MAKGIFARDNGGGDFETPEAGSYIARCFKLIDIGTQETSYLGKVSYKRQLKTWFELLEDEEGKPYRMSDGKPFTIMQTYTLSTNSQATLRQHIDAWRGKALTKEEAENFNVVVLLGKCCRLQISLDERENRTYANIASVGYTKKNPEGVNPEFWWTIDEPDLAEFEKFPEWLQTKIQAAQEWPEVVKTAAAAPAKPKDAEGTITENGDVVITELPEEDDPLDVSELKF